MAKKFGFSWSWKRAIGLSGLKNKISRKIGVPFTKGGRQRKIGNMLGCCISFITLIISFLIITTVIFAIS